MNEYADARTPQTSLSTCATRTAEYSLHTTHTERPELPPVAGGGLQLLPFFSMVDRRKRLHCVVMKLRAAAPVGMLQTVIAMAADVERSGRAPRRESPSSRRPAPPVTPTPRL